MARTAAAAAALKNDSDEAARRQEAAVLALKNVFGNSSRARSSFQPVSSRRASVLVGLFWQENDWHVLLTRRSSKMRSHAAEVCLPGGKMDDADNGNNLENALREAHEEIGLPKRAVLAVLGELRPRLSAHLLSVTPVVCLIQRPIFPRTMTTRSLNHRTDDKGIDDDEYFVVTPNPSEVESVFSCPLRLFHETSPQHSFYDYDDFYNHTVRIHEFHHVFQKTEYCIWGLTAHILIQVSARVYHNKTDIASFSSSHYETTRGARKGDTTIIELDPPGLPRHIDLRVAEHANDDDSDEAHKIVVSVCADG